MSGLATARLRNFPLRTVATDAEGICQSPVTNALACRRRHWTKVRAKNIKILQEVRPYFR
jgi:hypothetical protein